MITFTDTAKEKFEEVVKDAGEGCVGLRVRAHKLGRHTLRYQMHLVGEQETDASDVAIDLGGFKAYVDPESAELMKDATVDYISDESSSGFEIDNPAAKVQWEDPVAQKVQDVLDQKVLPALAQHGGWVELVEVKGDAAHVQLGGGCQGCAGARATLKQGIEAMVVREVPEIERVVDETDHSAGHTPYA